MGSGEEKSRSLSGKLTTIILIVVLIFLAVILILILKDPRGFDRFKKQRETKPSLKPVMNQQLHNGSDQPKLEVVDGRPRVVGEIS
jgi:hypothetical protein